MSDLADRVADAICDITDEKGIIRANPRVAAQAILRAIEADGFRIVPVEPTQTMLACVRWDDDDTREGWECLLAAAPMVPSV